MEPYGGGQWEGGILWRLATRAIPPIAAQLGPAGGAPRDLGKRFASFSNGEVITTDLATVSYDKGVMPTQGPVACHQDWIELNRY